MDDIERMERYLSQIYKECKVDIEKEAKYFFKKYTKQDKQWQKQVADGEKGKDEYQRWRLLHIAKGERFTNIQDHIAETLTNINGIASDYVNGQLPAIYTKHFNALSKSVPVTIDYKFGLVDVNAIKSAVDTNSDFLPLHIFKRTKDFAYQKQSVKDTIIKGIIKGDSIDKMIDELTWLTNVNNSYAKRIVRTAVTATANKGRLDSYKRAEEDGIEIQKQWVATVGSDRTRDWHLELHGQVKPIDEPFENEFGEIMYPGDPNAHPENIYYCRCTMIAKIAGFRKK